MSQQTAPVWSIEFAGEDDLPDHFHPVPFYPGTGASLTATGTGIQLGVNTDDTIKYLIHLSAIAEGAIAAVFEEDNTTIYQNNSGKTAIVSLVISATGSGTLERHPRVYSAPNSGNLTGALLRWEIGTTQTNILDADLELLTTPPLFINDNHFIVVENVDDSRAGINSILVTPISAVVERAP